MIERYIDKKIRVLDKICKFDSYDIRTIDLNLSADELYTIMEGFAKDNLLEIHQRSIVTAFSEEIDEEVETDDIYIIYKIKEEKKIINLHYDLKKKYPKREKPIFQDKVLQIISKDIGEMSTGTVLIKFLKECGVENELIIYPNTKWKMIFDVLQYLAKSDKPEDYQALCKIIEEPCHPLFHDGNENVANDYKNKFNKILKYDGFAVLNNKLTQINETKGEEPEENKVITDQVDICNFSLSNLKRIKKILEIFYDQLEIQGTGVKRLKPYKIRKSAFDKNDFTYNEVELILKRFESHLSIKLLNDELKKKEEKGNLIFNLHGIDFIDLLSFFIVNINNLNILNDIKDLISKIDQIILKEPNNNQKNKKSKELFIKISEMPELRIQGISNQKEAKDINKINLSGNTILFDDDKAKIIIGNKECQLPAYKNEHYFCRAIWQHPVNEFVDWSIVFENMDKTLNSNKKGTEKDKRSVQDTLYAVNKRIKDVIHTEDDLFAWKEKSIKRNY